MILRDSFELPHVDCYGLKSFSTFAFTAASILMSGGQVRLKPTPGILFVSPMLSLLPLVISLDQIMAGFNAQWGSSI